MVLNQQKVSMDKIRTIQNILIIGALHFLFYTVNAQQYIYPEGSRLELLGTSGNLSKCKLFRNNYCNVFLFTENNVICSVAGSTDTLPSVAYVPEAGNCLNAFFAGEYLIVVWPKEIVALSQDMNSISQSVNETRLYKYGKRKIETFPSNSTGFFLVEHKTDKKTKQAISTLSYYDLSDKSVKSIVEAQGEITCVSGDTAVMCLGLDTNLIIIANRQVAVAATESEKITAVAPSLVGIFYSTPSSTFFLTEDLQKIVIAQQGALQLIDNCNTLYMILQDNSLLRLINTAAFRSFNPLHKQEPDGTKSPKN